MCIIQTFRKNVLFIHEALERSDNSTFFLNINNFVVLFNKGQEMSIAKKNFKKDRLFISWQIFNLINT
jgi:hypothetical protein